MCTCQDPNSKSCPALLFRADRRGPWLCGESPVPRQPIIAAPLPQFQRCMTSCLALRSTHSPHSTSDFHHPAPPARPRLLPPASLKPYGSHAPDCHSSRARNRPAGPKRKSQQVIFTPTSQIGTHSTCRGRVVLVESYPLTFALTRFATSSGGINVTSAAGAGPLFKPRETGSIGMFFTSSCPVRGAVVIPPLASRLSARPLPSSSSCCREECRCGVFISAQMEASHSHQALSHHLRAPGQRWREAWGEEGFSRLCVRCSSPIHGCQSGCLQVPIAPPQMLHRQTPSQTPHRKSGEKGPAWLFCCLGWELEAKCAAVCGQRLNGPAPLGSPLRSSHRGWEGSMGGGVSGEGGGDGVVHSGGSSTAASRVMVAC
uniref:Uncharacterized protein n=1 Tax=Knipowitschia caucasica TaxID=637954 RepID=A0AAV2JL75_KNICA